MRTFLPLLLIVLPVVAHDLSAQNREHPYFRGSVGFAGGQFGFETDDRFLDDDTDAGLLQLEFEATSPRGFGGGVRFEALASDNDLFVANGVMANRARNGTLFAHATYRIEEHRFEMPIRFGLLLNNLALEEDATGLEVNYASLGPYFEVEPQVTLIRRGGFRWSLYGQLGVGAAVTAIDIDNDFRDYTSSTGFLGVELGTKFRAGPAEIGFAYVGRFQSMDESDVESGQVAVGYDADFNGLLLTFGVVF